jgi:hypothetical protein
VFRKLRSGVATLRVQAVLPCRSVFDVSLTPSPKQMTLFEETACDVRLFTNH